MTPPNWPIQHRVNQCVRVARRNRPGLCRRPRDSPGRCDLGRHLIYRVACLVDMIEAVSGTFNYRYTVGKEGGKGEGDVNKTPKKDVRSFIKTFDLTVQ